MAETGRGRRGQLERLHPGDLHTKQAQLIGLSGTGSPFITDLSRVPINRTLVQIYLILLGFEVRALRGIKDDIVAHLHREFTLSKPEVHFKKMKALQQSLLYATK